MATTNTPVPVRTAQSSSLEPIIDISKFLAGQRTTGDQTVTGQTAPLEAILAQMTSPGNLEALVANLFSQGAAQVPGLTSQFANATGTRTSNNTMLAQSLAALNQSIAQAIAQSVVQQQSAAAGAAGKLAETNKTVTSTQRQTPDSLLRALIPTLVGTGLNKAGKMMDASKAPVDASVAATPMFSEAQAGEFAIPELGLVPQDVASAGLPGIDFSAGLDFGGAVGAADVADYDFGPVEVFDEFAGVSDFAGFDPNFGFLRDGGRVRRRPVGYADGGQPSPRGQVRNIPNFGPRVAPVRTPAFSIMPQAQQRRRLLQQEEVSDPSAQGATAVGVPAATPMTAGVSPFGSIAPTTLGLGTLQAMMMMSAPINVVVEALVTRGIVQAVKGLLTPSVDAPVMPPATIPSEDTLTTEAVMPPAISIGDAGISMPAAETPSMAETFGIDAGGFDTGEGSTTDSGDSSTGDSGSVGDAASAGVGGGGFRDGGKVREKIKGEKVPTSRTLPSGTTGKNPPKGIIRGSGTPTSDSITAKVSVDEYILPADTVAAIGKDLLDSIVASTHTPVAGGTRG